MDRFDGFVNRSSTTGFMITKPSRCNFDDFFKGAYINLDKYAVFLKVYSLYSGMTRIVIDLELATHVFTATVLVDRYSLIKQSPILP